MALVSLEMGIAVIVEAILSFVGLSVSSDTPTWGGMIAEGRQIHSSNLVGARGAAGSAVRDRACLQPAWRRIAPRARPGAEAMTAPLLSIRALSAISELGNGQPILRNVSLDLAPGETLGLVGESGAGKSTIAKALLGVLPRTVRITSGEILFEGRDLRTMARRETRAIFGDAIALVPQDPMTALNPGRRIEAQLTDGLRLRRGLNAGEARKRALELLAAI